MKVLASLKQAKLRHRDCQVVKRRGRLYVICKSNPRFKCVQGLLEAEDQAPLSGDGTVARPVSPGPGGTGRTARTAT